MAGCAICENQQSICANFGINQPIHRYRCANPESRHEFAVCSDECMQVFHQLCRSFTEKAKKNVRKMSPSIKRLIQEVIDSGNPSVVLCEECFSIIDLSAGTLDPDTGHSKPTIDKDTSGVTRILQNIDAGTLIRGWKLGERHICEQLLVLALTGSDTSSSDRLCNVVDAAVLLEFVNTMAQTSTPIRIKRDLLNGENAADLLCHLLSDMPQEFRTSNEVASTPTNSMVDLANAVSSIAEEKVRNMKTEKGRMDGGEARSVEAVAAEFLEYLRRQPETADPNTLVAYYQWPQRSFDDPREISALLPEEGWRRCFDPNSGEYWWRREKEWFYERATMHWVRYDTGEGTDQHWWQHISETRWFPAVYAESLIADR